MTATSATDLAALLCSRLCHDMLSPVGALSNGLELLASETDPEMRQNCIELLEQSATISANKLKYFRLAYGAAGGFGDRVGVEEPKDLIQSLATDKGRIEVNWALSGGTLAKPAVKVLLNFAQIALDAQVPLSEVAEHPAHADLIQVRFMGRHQGLQPALQLLPP